MAGRAIEPAIRPLGFDWRIGIGLISSFAAREVFVSSMGVIFGVEDSRGKSTTPLRTALRQARWPGGASLFTPLVCLTLMIYYVFAMQCMSTIAVVKRETNSWRWPLFQTAYMTGTAWLLCLVVLSSRPRHGILAAQMTTGPSWLYERATEHRCAWPRRAGRRDG